MTKANTPLILLSLIISALLIFIFWKVKDQRPNQPSLGKVDLFSIPGHQFSGQTIFREHRNELIVNIDIASSAAKTGFAVYAIKGKCEQLKDVLYRLSTLYFRKSSTTLSITYNYLKSQLPFSVVIYDTPDTMKNIVYCGEVSRL